MSKTLLFLVIAVLIAGGVIGLYTSFNPLTTVQNLIQNPSTILPWLESALNFIKQNIWGFITGGGAMLALAAKAYSSHKQKTTQTVDTLKAQSSETITRLEAEKQEVQAKLETRDDQWAGSVQKLSNQLADTQQDLRTAQEDVDLFRKERDHWYNKAKEWEAVAKERKAVA